MRKTVCKSAMVRSVLSILFHVKRILEKSSTGLSFLMIDVIISLHVFSPDVSCLHKEMTWIKLFFADPVVLHQRTTDVSTRQPIINTA